MGLSTKYTRDKEGHQIVQIKTVTKYKRTESKSKPGGLQDISSTEDEEATEKWVHLLFSIENEPFQT